MADVAEIDLEKTTEPTDLTNHPFPWRQLAVLATCRIVEPIAFCSITTYSFLMVQDIHGEENASMYPGLLISVFAGFEALTAWIWGDVSDRLGRKPCILFALTGTALSCLILGFSKHYWLAVMARIIGGALNGNTAVMQTMVVEIVKNPKHEPFAYAMQPFMWYVGSIAGSAMGGFTARPVERWPRLKGSIFEEYPYLLPNVLSTVAIAMAGLVGWAFLEETNTRKQRAPSSTPNVLIEAGQQVIATFNVHPATHRRGSTDSNVSIDSNGSADSTTPVINNEKTDQKPIKSMTRPVLGWILALAIVPYNILPMIKNMPNPDVGLYAVIVLQCLETTASYPLVLILLKNACPSPEVLGRVIGVAMSACSLARTFGPPLAGILYDKLGSSVCWWSATFVAVAGFVQLFFCRRPPHTA